MPADPSSPIPATLTHLTQTNPRELQEAEAPHLLAYLAAVPDPRASAGRRHPQVAILAVAVAAVLAGARSFAAIAEWAADTPQPIRAALGARRDVPDHWAVPAETTIRRTLARLDADALAGAVGAWLADRQRHAPGDRAAQQRPPRQRAVAVDGKTLRGAHPPDGDGRPVHLLACMDHATRAVLAQQQVGGAPEEVPGVRSLLAGLDLAGGVVTADALHTMLTLPSSWSPASRPTTCSRSRPTSPPCWPACSACRGSACPSPTGPVTVATAASSSAPSRSSPSATSAFLTPPRSSRSPARAPSASPMPAANLGAARP